MKYGLAYLLICYSVVVQAQLSKVLAKSGSSGSTSTFKVDSNLLAIQKVAATPPIYAKFQPATNNKSPAIAIIDSIKVSNSYFQYMDPNDISTINILKNKEYPDGLMFVKLKDERLLLKLLQSRLLSLKDLTDTYVNCNERQKPIIFLVNKELVTDTSGVRIPEICLANITVAQAAQMPYFKTTFPDALIIMITTHQISNKPYQPDIMIRGKLNN